MCVWVCCVCTYACMGVWVWVWVYVWVVGCVCVSVPVCVCVSGRIEVHDKAILKQMKSISLNGYATKEELEEDEDYKPYIGLQAVATSCAQPRSCAPLLSGDGHRSPPSGVNSACPRPPHKSKVGFTLLGMTCPHDRFKIYKVSTEVLGCGSFGTVFATKHQDFATPLAMKTFKVQNLASAMAEVYVLEKLGPHPQIAALWDAWLDTREQPHVVLERWGSSLHHVLHSKPAPTARVMPMDYVRRVTRDVVRALGHVHTMGLLHSDLKPGNILVFEEKAKLCDWGSALEVALWNFQEWSPPDSSDEIMVGNLHICLHVL